MFGNIVFMGAVLIVGITVFMLMEHRQAVKAAEETMNMLINEYHMTPQQAADAFEKANGEK